eukprot:TRINITY_DN22630_c0_g1_i1.p1 TRINITY_DN22630_c0_g1~~TRINITY_DN22630_c0_g1_i1.p1  ORF type:complete len:633 (+),score=226.34 TRINITY_DN22630_c0_g1_i1:33-1931(+)
MLPVCRTSLRTMSTKVQAFVDQMNDDYAKLHNSFEDNFWATKMNLEGNSTDELTRTKIEYEGFLQKKEHLTTVRAMLKEEGVSETQKSVLQIMERTLLCYMMETEDAAKLKEQTVAKESVLEERRNGMKLGYTDPKTGEFVAGSTGMLRDKMRTSDDEALRKACWEGMRSVGPFVVEDFCDIVKLRNQTSRKNGYADYYEYKIQTTEGFDKARLFEILDDLEASTRPILEKARAKLAADKGEQALEPWNMGYSMAGSVVKEMDPYFPFDRAVSAWARSFAAMGIEYRKSVMNLDLCDREKKYSNGFCHWPVCPYVKPDGTEVACVTNFTSLAIPSAVGSGHTALTTLMHEGGHAAHFANIVQPSPFFSQERAPMSVAYAENQSMFLDSLVGDAAWVGRYAKSNDGSVLPWDLFEKKVRQTHDYQVFAVRSMLIVPYFEKALYELPEEEVTPENVLRLADEIDMKLFGGMCARPCLAVPHILADESSCYYQGYILAEMSVYQTRNHFLQKYGHIVDNEQVGKDLAEVYWRPGNSENFLALVEKMTGKPLTADAMVEDLKQDVEDRLAGEKKDYAAAVQAGPKYSDKDDVAKLLNMRMRLVHGDRVIADSDESGFSASCEAYRKWIVDAFPAKA